MPAVTSLAIAAALSVGRTLKRFVQALKNRRAARLLTRFDDRMLADIGLTRSDVRDAYAEPLWHDPTDMLARRVAERRVNRRGIALRRPPEAATQFPSVDRAALYLT